MPITIELPPGSPKTGREVVERMKLDGVKKVMLAFSCGKDSIAAWLSVRDHFDVLPFYQESPPGLEFVEESLAYYERFFGAHIHRIVHPSFYRQLQMEVYQSPERRRIIERADGVESFSYEEMRRWLCEGLGEPMRWQVSGVRAADNLLRRSMFRQYGPITHTRQVFYPIFDWNVEDMTTEFKRTGVRMPVDYQLFGRSFDGIDYRFIVPIREHFPEDYARLLEWFPLVDVQLVRKKIWDRTVAAQRG